MTVEAVILDGDQRSALAVTRSLGKKGIKVVVGADVEPSLASRSRYCGKAFRYPSPLQTPEQFIENLRSKIEEWPDAILIPMTDVTLTEILRRRTDFGNGITIPFDEYDKYILLSDKTTLFRLSKELGTPSPRTIISTDYEGNAILSNAKKNIGFPLVVKTGLSTIRTESGWIRGGVRYAKDESELQVILSEDIFLRFPFVIQERIQGPGMGVFLLLERGDVLASFAHLRIREKPPSGGVSVVCESIEPPSSAMESAMNILGGERWSGIAMVEFKIDKGDGIPKLIEVNARFWGSLQLAVTSGVDFPYLLYRWARGERIESTPEYRVGVKSRWELGDFDHLYSRVAKSPSRMSLPPGYPSRFAVLKEFLSDFFRPSVRNEVLQWSDPAPFFHEARQYLRGVAGSISR
jgi:predicted ATP-grasp superfamily ATP-dependent carboligase